MKYSQDHDAAWFGSEIDAVRETMRNDTPNIRMRNGKLQGVYGCLRYAAVDLAHELKGKT
jgi:hypothetical protein